MIARRRFLAGLAPLVCGPAMAQLPAETPVVIPIRSPRGRAARRAEPLPLPPPAPPALSSRGEPAPVPDHDVLPPSRPAAQASAQLNPALIDPAEPMIGTSRDRASLQAREDRLLRQPAAGARLRLPFGY
jgi:hypothetical protein